MKLRRKKIEIKISKLLLQIAIADASAAAVRHEMTRQTREQIKGTWLENAKLTVEYSFADVPDLSPGGAETWHQRLQQPPAPDSRDLTFTWVD